MKSDLRIRLWQRLGIALFWLSWPALWVYLRWSQRTRALIVVGDEVLLTKTWHGDGKWSLPGGGLHRHEAPIDGLRREVAEETGINLSAADIQPLGTDMYRNHGLRFKVHYFGVRLRNKPPTQRQKLEISDIGWRLRDDISPRDFAPDVIEGLRRLDSSADNLL